jgi:dTDP-4-dehydrorhamnose 3,5-epimerase
VNLDIRRFEIEGPLLIAPKRFGDRRGFFSETYSTRAFSEAGISETFVQDNHSASAMRGTVRGLHFQVPPHAQAKLVRVPRGRIMDVAVDIRRNSSTYGRHVCVELSADNWLQLLVPIGFAHGFCTLDDDSEVIYKTSDYYAPEAERGVSWNDPALAIAWPDFAGAALSAKDGEFPRLADFKSPF